MTRIVLALALIANLGFAQDVYKSSKFIQKRSHNADKKSFTASVGFELGSASANVEQKSSFNTQPGGQQNQDYKLSMKGFNLQGTYDWDAELGEGMGTSTSFGISFLSSSGSDDEKKPTNGFQNTGAVQQNYDAKKTSLYVEQAITFNVEFDGFVIQPFAALLLGVGKFTMDSQTPASSTNFLFNQNAGFRNLETNFFQAGATFGSNFIISDTFVPYLKGKFTKEFHSVSTFNTGSTQQFGGFSGSSATQDPNIDSTTFTASLGVGFRF